MAEQVDTCLARARAAFDAHAWASALTQYRDAAEAGDALSPEERERMAAAAWLAGEPAGELLEAAFDAYDGAGHPQDAARVAIDLIDHHALLGERSRAMGWARGPRACSRRRPKAAVTRGSRSCRGSCR